VGNFGEKSFPSLTFTATDKQIIEKTREKVQEKYEKTKMKKALRKTQTLLAGCSKAEPKNFAPPQTPSRGCGTAKI